MSKIAPQGKFKGFAAGDKLYTYEAGTSTPKNTFTDSALGSANTNPVILDTNAQADVWLDNGGYKFVLADTNDVVYWTTDNIDGSQSGGFGSVVTSISSNLSLTNLFNENVIICTASLTIGLQAASAAGEGFVFVVVNRSSGNITIDPFGSELINGAATLVIPVGSSATIHCDGVEWYASGYADVTKSADTTFTGDNTFTGTNTFTGAIDLSTASVTYDVFDNLTVLGNVSGGASTATEVDIIDDDTMATASATTLATSESIKTYVDNEVSANPRVVAKVVFNGSGTPAIISQFNVSSITDHGTGEYTINFTNSLSTADYAWVGSARNAFSDSANARTVVSQRRTTFTKTVDALRIVVTEGTSGTAVVDSESISVIVVI